MNFLKRPSWSPYLVGALLGMLSWFTVWSAGDFLGTSTSFVRWAGLAEQTVAAEHVAGNEYYTKTKIKVDWQMMLVVGMFLGAFASAWLSGERKAEWVPALWAGRFGRGKAFRLAAAFGGGALVLFGARMAGGCTSGHGLSGSMQFAVSSWTFFAVMFGTAIATAFALYGKTGEASHV